MADTDEQPPAGPLKTKTIIKLVKGLYGKKCRYQIRHLLNRGYSYEFHKKTQQDIDDMCYFFQVSL